MTATVAPTDDASPPEAGVLRVALLGNPNTGKTTLFNRLCGLRHKTSNFPGTTQESRVGFTCIGSRDVEVIDLPGVYSLELDQSESSVCRGVLAGQTAPKGEAAQPPDAVCIVVDASNLARNLAIVGEALRRRLATVVVINMQDIAARRGLRIDVERLSEALGCEVVASQARSGEGIAAIREALTRARIPTDTPPGDEDGLVAWVDRVYEKAIAPASMDVARASFTDRLDRAFTHPIIGLVLFAAVMTGLFWVLFRLATVPMDLIDGVFGSIAAGIESVLPPGFLADMLANGVVAGVGATVIFLPQIVLLFLLISLLEDTGYLARAAFVMDRALRPFGLAGHSFVPLLSSHACALPGIMSARMIPDRRQRLATILVAPFMTCSARLPVYALLVTVLFPGRPGMQALAFTGSYALGVVVALLSALLARRTILRGEGRPMALELPAYRLPSLKSALLTTWDRSLVFLRKAGTVILAISVVLWWLGSYPIVDPPEDVASMRAQASALVATSPEDAAALVAEADAAEASHAVRASFMGRIGRTVQPVFEPLGYDWQLSIGVMASFAAREVFVSTMAVVVSGQDDAEDEGVLTALRTAQRSDGTPIFTTATAWSLLVYYVLAMQCLPTLAVTAREAGGWKWAGLQLGWMTGVAYVLAMVVTQTLRLLGVS